jgi:hypothetical protein
VDTRSKVVKITHDRALDAGVILIVSKEGTKIVERDEITDPAKRPGTIPHWLGGCHGHRTPAQIRADQQFGHGSGRMNDAAACLMVQ